MKIPEAPCISCNERRLGCHAECPKYKEYEHAQKKYREHVAEQKIAENILEEIEVKRFRK